MWKSLHVTTGDVLVFIDADLIDWGTALRAAGCSGRCSPTPPSRSSRPSTTGRCSTTAGARPRRAAGSPSWSPGRCIALHHPELAGLVQPLAGEWAVRRTAFERCSVPVGYGVEIAALVDTADLLGRGRHRPGRPRPPHAPPPPARHARADGGADPGRRRGPAGPLAPTWPAGRPRWRSTTGRPRGSPPGRARSTCPSARPRSASRATCRRGGRRDEPWARSVSVGTSSPPTDRLMMAIVNRTPDSFYDKGATWAEDAAFDRVAPGRRARAPTSSTSAASRPPPVSRSTPTRRRRRVVDFVDAGARRRTRTW